MFLELIPSSYFLIPNPTKGRSEFMKIFKARNGIALAAVLVIMLITSLFIPVMFSLGDTSLSIAVQGEDRQRASYFARTVTEMSVAAFKAFESNEHVRCKTKVYDNNICTSCGLKKYDSRKPNEKDSAVSDDMIAAYNNLIGQPIPSASGTTPPLILGDTGYPERVTSITTDVIVMAVRTHPTETQQLYYVRYLDDSGNALAGWVEISAFEHRKLGEELQKFKDANKTTGAVAPYQLYPDPTDSSSTGGTTDSSSEISLPNDAPKEEIKYFSCTKDNNGNVILPTEITNGVYKEIGRGYCEITYDNSTTYYRTIVEKDASKYTDKENDYYKKIETISKTQYDAGIEYLSDPTNTGKIYSYSKKENKNVKFKSYVTVDGFTSSRTCILVLPTYPSEEEWLEFGVADPDDPTQLIPSGGNQIFVDPDKATSLVPITYTDPALASYVKQNLLVYSSVGNMVIRPTSYKNAATGATETAGANNTKFVLGIQPGLNTTPNNDPTYETIDSVNYESSTAVSQMNNFVAFSSTNAIQVDLPINLLVNPCRANRAGDNKIFGTNANGSLFKIMLFQAPIIQFNDTVDMMVSFYVRQRSSTDSMARRMSSVVLMAPESTPYSYYHNTYHRIVKAGMVYFAEDCYLWIIEPGDDGSSSSGWGFLAETVYKRDSDFYKMKIADAGDVYYFNSEVKNNGENVGFSLTAYMVETKYIKKMSSASGIWNKIASTAITSGSYTEIYDINDWQFVGNTNDGSLSVEPPKVDGYYTYWVN